MVPRKIKGMPYLSVRSGRWLLMLPLAERWGSPSSPLLWNHLEVGVIWLPRPSAVLVASWARDLASPPPSPLANCFRDAPCRCGEGMLPCGYTVSLQSPPSLTVLSEFFLFFVFCLSYIHITRVYCCCFLSFLYARVELLHSIVSMAILCTLTTPCARTWNYGGAQRCLEVHWAIGCTVYPEPASKNCAEGFAL